MLQIRSALIAFTVAAIALAPTGCGSKSISVLPMGPTSRQSALALQSTPAAGGPFTAHYVGTTVYVNHPGYYCESTDTGAGSGQFIGPSSLAETRGIFLGHAVNKATLTSNSNASDVINISEALGSNNCRPGDHSGTFKVTGGTGKFASARGSGSIHIDDDGSSGIVVNFTGTLTY